MSNLIKSLSLLVLFVFVSACESGGETPTLSLVGSWSAASFSANVESATTVNGISINTTSVTTGSDMNYKVTFTETEFTTAGDYTVTTNLTVNGTEQTFTSELVGVTGSGTYTSTADQIILSDSFFSLEVNGMPVQTGGQPQSASYEITSNNELIISQDQTITLTELGVTTTVTIVSSSRWTRD